MAKYISIPRVIEAEQYDGAGLCNGMFIHTFYCTPTYTDTEVKTYDAPAVKTINGNIAKVEPGDFIIQEPDGIHYYPCKEEIFKASYHKVKDEHGHLRHIEYPHIAEEVKNLKGTVIFVGGGLNMPVFDDLVQHLEKPIPIEHFDLLEYEQKMFPEQKTFQYTPPPEQKKFRNRNNRKKTKGRK